MQMTHRDVEILRFINDFGFCEMPQIQKRFELSKPRGYKVMQRLVQAGLVIHCKVFHDRHGIFYLSHRGASFTDLPPLATIPVGIYDHQLTIIKAYFKLMEQYPGTQWISERRLKREKFMKGIGKKGHVADGILIFPDNRQVAIEIELTIKGERRLKEIFKGYLTNYVFQEVWYYCSPKAINRVTAVAEGRTYIKTYSLDNLLNYSELAT